MIREINFDGFIGPTHNYAGLSLGNIASASNAGGISKPRAAALQGLGKMRTCLDLGLAQGLFVPPERPASGWLGSLGLSEEQAWKEDPKLFSQAMSASGMWAANAATVVPGADSADGKCHLTIANLSTMVHRSLEQEATEAQLRLVFRHRDFVVHRAVPGVFGDEGAANHMRLAGRHSEAGVEIFVFGEQGGRYPARQNRRASEAVARLSGLDPERTMFVRQSREAIGAGAFHNDVVAVANENVLFVHELAFENSVDEYGTLEPTTSPRGWGAWGRRSGLICLIRNLLR
jgi:succinylarginine dihydrolase